MQNFDENEEDIINISKIYSKILDQKERNIIKHPYSQKKCISYGLILISKEGRTLLVKRKHSFEYLVILSGRYKKSDLIFLIPKLVLKEFNKILLFYKNKKFFKKEYKNLFKNDKNIKKSYKKLIEYGNCVIEISKNINFSENDLIWFWPKGKFELLIDKDYKDCAIRETEEELDIKLPKDIKFYDDWISFTHESYNFRKLDSKFLICTLNKEFVLKKVKNDEISDKKWVCIQDLNKYIKNDKICKEFYIYLENLKLLPDY